MINEFNETGRSGRTKKFQFMKSPRFEDGSELRITDCSSRSSPCLKRPPPWTTTARERNGWKSCWGSHYQWERAVQLSSKVGKQYYMDECKDKEETMFLNRRTSFARLRIALGFSPEIDSAPAALRQTIDGGSRPPSAYTANTLLLSSCTAHVCDNNCRSKQRITILNNGKEGKSTTLDECDHHRYRLIEARHKECTDIIDK
ncbi:hypothetical protein KIN20_028053 [Parelaphostrongylus tenuis]|uniref:Uncharacterized protein n=1 Tax=Parelaphostrongylus tenuis TaxID=148309 RepID=A0AAD5WEG1_PARTN|nr:hypothetical protein KIN20_028053 [Parelaphostrongylus tenuis]